MSGPSWGFRVRPGGSSMMDLIYVALIAALFLLSLWMIRAFDRM
jgi:hypothetical protein